MIRGRRIANNALKCGSTGRCRNRWKRLKQMNGMTADQWF